MRSRLLFLAIGLVVGVALTAGATWANGFRTQASTHVSTDGSSFVGLVSDAAPEATYTFAAARVCKKGPAQVKITHVRIGTTINAVKLVDFAVAPTAATSHRVRGDIAAYLKEIDPPLISPPTRTLSTRCSPQHNDLRDVIVELRLPDRAHLPAAAVDFVIDYTVRGHSKSFRSGTGITFCVGEDADKQFDQRFDDDQGNDLIAPCTDSD